MAEPSEFRVLIIGGGNCGLAVATGLRKARVASTVLERDTEHNFTHNTRNWGMLLHWGTEYFEKLIPEHLLARVKEFRVDPSIEFCSTLPQVKADTGEILMNIEPPPKTNRFSRKKIRTLLTEDGSLLIKFDKKLQAISVDDSGVVAKFEDGSQESGSMIIGCDGSRSRVREFLVGKEAAELEDTGVTMINYAAEGYTPQQATLLRSYHPIVQLAYNHPNVNGGALLASLDIPDVKDPTCRGWKFQAFTSWRGPPYADDLQDPKFRTKYIRERMAQFCEPFRTSFLALDEDVVLPMYRGSQWAPRMQWDNHGGRVTIAGDAAHSMLPHRGQGLNNAMKDASDLVDAIKAVVAGSTSLSDAVSAYEEEMRARGTKEVDLSHESMEAMSTKEVQKSPMFRMGVNRS